MGSPKFPGEIILNLGNTINGRLDRSELIQLETVFVAGEAVAIQLKWVSSYGSDFNSRVVYAEQIAEGKAYYTMRFGRILCRKRSESAPSTK
jgi:hypothetical protein